MSITIGEALELSTLRFARLVAGKSGLHNPIKWVTIVEILEDLSRLHEGEFLITTGYGLADDPVRRKSLIRELAQRGVAGVAIHTGFYMDVIPADMAETADQIGFPIIEIPKEYNFSNVTKAILEQIVNRQIRMLAYSEDIHQQLTKIVLANKGFGSIAQVLQQLTLGGVRIYDDIWEKMAESLPEQEHSLYSDKDIRDIYFHLKETRQLDTLVIHKKKLEYVYTKDNKRLKLVFLPIVANDFIYGYIGVAKEMDRWEDLDLLAMEHAATVCAIEFLKQAAIIETEVRLRGDFLEELLGEHPKNEASLIERGKMLGIQLPLTHAVVCFRIHFTFDYFDDVEMQQLRSKLYHTVEHVLQQKKRQYLLRHRHDSLVLLLEIKNRQGKEDVDSLLEDINQHWRYYHPHLRLSIGVGTAAKNIEHYARSYWEAEVALRYGHLLYQTSPVVHYTDLGAYHLLFEMQEKGIDLEAFYQSTLGPLAVTGKKENNPLLTTLDIYFLYNLNIKEAAKALYIHRHTLKYRLQQIEKKTGRSLASPHDRLQLQLAVMAYKMLNNPNPT